MNNKIEVPDAPGIPIEDAPEMHSLPETSACQVSIIIATYREVGTQSILVPRLALSLAKASINAEILIIDDNRQGYTEILRKEFADTFRLRLVDLFTECGHSSVVAYGTREALGGVLVLLDAKRALTRQKGS